MKALSMYVWSLLVIMMMGLTSCGDDDELQFSEEQLAYINKNKEYIWEKKTEKDEMGELRYKQVVLGGDTALYRIIRKENEWTTTPTMTSVVYLLGLEGKFIDGQVFQKKLDRSSFSMNGIIPGLSGVLLNNVRLFFSFPGILRSSLRRETVSLYLPLPVFHFLLLFYRSA